MLQDYSRLCLSFYESITQPGVIVPPYFAYGVQPPPGCETCGNCTKPWGRKEREQWMRALYNAQTDIEARLSGEICPREICDEYHKVECPIWTNEKPVAYLGLTEQGPPISSRIFFKDKQGKWPPNCPNCNELDACPYDYPAITIIDKCEFPEWVTSENLVFEYLEKDCDRLVTAMKLAQPCITPITNGDDCVTGWVATWERYELADPKIDCRDFKDDSAFFCYVQVRWQRINEDLFMRPVETCSCEPCGCVNDCSCGRQQSLSYTTGDLLRGEICVNGIKKCGCPVKAVYLNYGAGVPCDFNNASLKEAIVKLAITKIKPDNKVCSCDEWDETVKYWQQRDPTAAQAFARELPFGSMMGGMDAWRILRNEEMRRKQSKSPRHGRFNFFHPQDQGVSTKTWQW